MTAVVIPYVQGMLNPVTADLGTPYLIEDRQKGYARFLTDLWTSESARDLDIIVLEQDVVPTPAQLGQMKECQQGWCAYDYPNAHLPHFGCVKWRAAFRRVSPNAARESLWLNPWHPCDYRECAVRLSQWLYRKGQREHVHEPPVEHRHPANHPADWVARENREKMKLIHPQWYR